MEDKFSSHVIHVVALGSYGDVFPMVGIAKHLSRRGHQVTLFTHAHFGYMAQKHKLDCVYVDTQQDYDRFANHPDLFDPRKAFSVYMDTVVLPNIQRIYTQLTAQIVPGRSIIVAPLTAFATRIIQEKYGIPLVTIHTIPMQIKSAYEIPKVASAGLPDWSPVWLVRLYWWIADRFVIDPLICPRLNAIRRDVGLPTVHRLLTQWVHSPDRVICMFPEWFASPQPDWPPNTVNTGFPLFDEGDENELPADVQQFLSEGSSPVVFMPGSLMQNAQAFFKVSLNVCQELGIRAIFLSRYRDQIPDKLPETIKYCAYIPFSRLLPHTAILVHHGGIGTSAQAMRAGIPQLIHPLAYDQFDNADRIRKLGIGTYIKPTDYAKDTLGKSVALLMTSPEFRQNCHSIASRFMGVNAIAQTCEYIEKMR